METNENKKDEKKPNIVWIQIMAGVAVGAILGIGTTIFTLNGKMERMDEQIKDLKEHTIVNQVSDNSKSNFVSTSNVNPLKLSDIIKNLQRQNVKTSYTENNCFTAENLNSFKKSKKQDQIVADLMNDNVFIELIISIKCMTPIDRQALLERCSKIAKPTWGDLGKISSEGQTDAGNEAELLISKAIVTKIKEMMNLSLDEIKRYYK
jgi:hypothetical protein